MHSFKIFCYFRFKFVILFFALITVFSLKSSAYASQFTLTWDPNQEPDINHYTVYWGTTSNDYTENSEDIGLTTTYSVTIPDDNRTYYFAVTAIDDMGLESDYSNEVNTGNISTDKILSLANAGPDQIVNEGILVILDGSNSIDLDGNTLSYQWIQTGGIPVTLDDPLAIQAIFDSPYVDTDGESLTFQLTVADESGLQSTDSCIVNIVSVNTSPIANAGPDQNINEGSLVYLSGSNSSDPEGRILSYQWTQTNGLAVTLDDPTTDQPSFNSPIIESDGESLSFQLTVTDEGGLQSTDSCVVNTEVSPKLSRVI